MSRQSTEPRQDANGIVTNGFQLPDITVEGDAVPPPYGENLDQMQFSQPGFEAGAVLTGAYYHSSNMSYVKLTPIHLRRRQS